MRRRRAAQQSCRLRRGARGRRESRSGATGHVATCTPTLNRSVALDRLASHYIALRRLAFHSIGLQCLVLRPLTSYCQTKHCSRCVFYQHAQYALCGLVRTCINACTDKCNRANESDNLFSFISAVHVMSATTTNTKAAMVSTQAASTVQSCRVATAVGLLDLNARLLGSWDSMRLG